MKKPDILAIRLTEKMRSKIDEIAEADEKTTSEYVRGLIEKHIKEKESGK